MRFDTSFGVPLPISEAWTLLQDIERVARWFPGARLDGVRDEGFRGTVRVKLGPMLIDYKGVARFTERDEEARRVVIEATGRDERGAGTARAKAVTELRTAGEGTDVTVAMELDVTGRPAQLGQGLMQEVAERLVVEFSRRMEAELSATTERASVPGSPAASSPTPGHAPAPGSRDGSAPRCSAARPSAGGALDDDVLDLGRVAGPAVAKRVLPAAAVVVLLLAMRWLSRRRHC